MIVESPKSAILQLNRTSSSKLSGLRSRWITLFEWRQHIPAAISQDILTFRGKFKKCPLVDGEDRPDEEKCAGEEEEGDNDKDNEKDEAEWLGDDNSPIVGEFSEEDEMEEVEVEKEEEDDDDEEEEEEDKLNEDTDEDKDDEMFIE